MLINAFGHWFDTAGLYLTYIPRTEYEEGVGFVITAPLTAIYLGCGKSITVNGTSDDVAAEIRKHVAAGRKKTTSEPVEWKTDINATKNAIGTHFSEPGAPKDDDDGWIKWQGGECPENPGVQVEIICKNMDESTRSSAGDFRWSHQGWPSDIIKYRIIEKE